MLAEPVPCSRMRCKHYRGIIQPDGTEQTEVDICEAFPNGIPAEITTGRNLHTESFEGDRGILFEPAIKVDRFAAEGWKGPFKGERGGQYWLSPSGERDYNGPQGNGSKDNSPTAGSKPDDKPAQSTPEQSAQSSRLWSQSSKGLDAKTSTAIHSGLQSIATDTNPEQQASKVKSFAAAVAALPFKAAKAVASSLLDFARSTIKAGLKIVGPAALHLAGIAAGAAIIVASIISLPTLLPPALAIAAALPIGYGVKKLITATATRAGNMMDPQQRGIRGHSESAGMWDASRVVFELIDLQRFAEGVRGPYKGERGGVYWLTSTGEKTYEEPTGDDAGSGTDVPEGADADKPKSKIGRLLALAASVPAAIKDKAAAFISKTYEKLTARYGPTGAKLVLAGMVALLPIPIPGTSMLPVAIAEGVKRVHSAVVGTHADSITGESSDQPTEPEQLDADSLAVLILEQLQAAYAGSGEPMGEIDETELRRVAADLLAGRKGGGKAAKAAIAERDANKPKPSASAEFWSVRAKPVELSKSIGQSVESMVQNQKVNPPIEAIWNQLTQEAKGLGLKVSGESYTSKGGSRYLRVYDPDLNDNGITIRVSNHGGSGGNDAELTTIQNPDDFHANLASAKDLMKRKAAAYKTYKQEKAAGKFSEEVEWGEQPVASSAEAKNIEGLTVVSYHSSPEDSPHDDCAAHGLEWQTYSDSRAPTDQVALAGPDGRRAAELLADAKSRGGEILNHLARRAVTRVMKSEDPQSEIESLDTLLDDDERAALADALAAVTATADLLGRSRIRERAHQAELRHTQHVEFAEGDSFQAFVDPPPPVPPTRAIDYFKSLVPGLSVDPVTFGPAIYQQAFTMAATADQVLLGRVKDLILGALEVGSAPGTPQAIEDVLRGAGVLPGNPAYSDNVFRTNMMNSYNRGAQDELQSPGMADDYFPVWQYSGIADGRERQRHHVHFDRYYPSQVTFEEVRDSELGSFDGFSCRCTLIPIDKFTWAELQAGGAKIADGWE